MAKPKSNFVCSTCGGVHLKWAGRCDHCGEWNTLVESLATADSTSGGNRFQSWTGAESVVMDLSEVNGATYARYSTGINELDRVMGGGLVQGSVTLIGGDPGIGKSTLLLQVLSNLGDCKKVLYATGEESQAQIALRAARLGRADAKIRLMAEIELEKILATLMAENPAVVVIDSIQTMYSALLQSAPGTVAQVRECAAKLTHFAKSRGIALFLVGHVTKDGTLAGPRVLEHIVDTVLYFEGEQGSAFRMIRAFKNRFGSVNELGVFCMGEYGLEEVTNPSSMFLTAHERPVAGTCVLAALEGNRPFLVEVQALVEDAPTPNAKRSASGVDTNRLQMLLAVLNKHAGIIAFDKNVYAKIVGGVRLTEPAADLAVLLATYSSLVGRPLPDGLVVFGEVGLAGEIRPVENAEARLKEAAKLGFTRAIVPTKCAFGKNIEGITVTTVSRIDHALNEIRTLTQNS
jgi:DNA repair protein RadA/Sms